jgi:uncharacterized membrane protein
MPGERVRDGDFVDRNDLRDRPMQGDTMQGDAVSVNDEPTLGDLFSSLTEDMSTLIRQEVDLARTETMEKVSSATRSVVSMVAGGMIAYAGLIGVMIAVIVGLSRFMPLWLSALIVGIVVIVIGAIMIMSGRSSLQKMTVVPEQTVESMKENTEWAKEQVR